jgi:hypothetical protein
MLNSIFCGCFGSRCRPLAGAGAAREPLSREVDLGVEFEKDWSDSGDKRFCTFMALVRTYNTRNPDFKSQVKIVNLRGVPIYEITDFIETMKGFLNLESLLISNCKLETLGLERVVKEALPVLKKLHTFSAFGNRSSFTPECQVKQLESLISTKHPKITSWSA